MTDRSEPAEIRITDTDYFGPRDACGAFRDGLRAARLPWAPDPLSGKRVTGRIESAELRGGSVSRMAMTSHLTLAPSNEAVASEAALTYVAFSLTGGVCFEHDAARLVADRGDFVIFTGRNPPRITNISDGGRQVLIFVIPAASLHRHLDHHGPAAMLGLQGCALSSPAATCGTLMSQHLLCWSRADLSALFDALVSLLALTPGLRGAETADPAAGSLPGDVQAALLGYIDRHIAEPDLTVRSAAERLGVSERYVHRLMARSSTTFSGYLSDRRLGYIRKELESREFGRRPISQLAFRWGFADLSTFGRAFRAKFGCTPSQYRCRAGR